MLRFAEMTYQRPDAKALCAEYDALCERIRTAPDAPAQLDAFAACEKMTRMLATQCTLAQIRHSLDVANVFYDAENDFYDAVSPALDDKLLNVYRALLASPFRPQLEAAMPPLLFEKMELAVKASSPEILDLMAEENALVSAYARLYASAQIPFDGKVLTVSQLTPYKQDRNRNTRRAAYEAEGAWFDAQRDQLDTLYDQLVHNRTQQANRMGYDNFVPLGAIRMRRVGYTQADMAALRKQVLADVVPVAQKLKTLQHARTGIQAPALYDDVFAFADGNPCPEGTPEEIMAAGCTMYRALSPETAACINAMFDADVFDVLSRKGKEPGGYCTYLPEYHLPFVFSNFNGTSGDVDVLTHEVGHAFAAFEAAKQGLPLLLEEAGMESCEIHSMSMEFLTAEYHHLFFGAQTEKYALSHTEDALFFLPYGCLVDAFQHLVYTQPELTPAQRNAAWLRLEGQYRPWLDFAGLPFYSRGAGWQRQMHIYMNPFYYIDYCLAQIVALQFFLAAQTQFDDAWRRYLTLVGAAGAKTYTELVAAAGFASPFADGTLRAVADSVGKWVETADSALHRQ